MLKAVLLAIGLILVGLGQVSGQKMRFTDSSNVWNVVSGCSCDPPPDNQGKVTFSYSTVDSIINGVHYCLLTGTGVRSYIPLKKGLIREDTLTHRVFIRGIYAPPSTQGIDTVERLLYDYNLLVGDTFRAFGGNYHWIHYVSSIDSTYVNGTVHKVWHFDPSYQPGVTSGGLKSYYVIEGIGCLDHPLFPAFPHIFEEDAALLCFFSKGLQPMVSPKVALYYDNLTSCTLGVDDNILTKGLVTVVPNPVTKASIIRLPARMRSGTLSIYNSAGQLVARTAFSNSSAIQMPAAVERAGLYLFEVRDAETGRAFTGRFIHE